MKRHSSCRNSIDPPQNRRFMLSGAGPGGERTTQLVSDRRPGSIRSGSFRRIRTISAVGQDAEGTPKLNFVQLPLPFFEISPGVTIDRLHPPTMDRPTEPSEANAVQRRASTTGVWQPHGPRIGRIQRAVRRTPARGDRSIVGRPPRLPRFVVQRPCA
jgi:hypothetical protein